jgi:hypothetical protein
MTEQEQVQVTKADIHAAAIQWCGEKDRETSLEDIRYFKANWKSLPGLRGRVEAFARHRHTATADALEAMREAREALEDVWNNVSFRNVCVPMVSKAHARLTAAIAKIEGEQP